MLDQSPTKSSGVAPSSNSPPSLGPILDNLRDQSGRSLRQLGDERPTLVCLLRHNGCTFCRETLAELGKRREAIASAGLNIAVVGMSADAGSLRALGERFGLSGVSWFADPERLLYRALEIPRGGLLQLLGPRVVFSGLRGLVRGYGFGRVEGDPSQMPGTAVIHRGAVVRRFVHRTAADRPDYQKLACSLSA